MKTLVKARTHKVYDGPITTVILTLLGGYFVSNYEVRRNPNTYVRGGLDAVQGQILMF